MERMIRMFWFERGAQKLGVPLSVPESSIVVKSKKKWWKQTRITVKLIEKRKVMVTRSKMQQAKDQSEKKEVFRPEEARWIQEKRGSTNVKQYRLKKKLTEQFAFDSQK